MAGTKEGGKRAAATNKATHGEDFYARIGAIGGKLSNNGGFAKRKICTDPSCEYSLFGEKHRVAECAGSRGGVISRKGSSRV